jgi:hypothetical protein
MLYGNEGGKDSAEVFREPVEESADSGKWAYFTAGDIDPPTGTEGKVVEYELRGATIVKFGPYIPTLVKLLHQGYFE